MAKPKKNVASSSRMSRADFPKKSLPNLIFFWPFHLFHRSIRNKHIIWRTLLRIIGDPFIAGLYVLFFLSVFYGIRAKAYDLSKLHEMPERSVIYDKNGKELIRLHGEIRDVITLDQISPNFRKAIIAREDKRFYQHGAFDIIGIIRAAYKNYQGKREGASTITQQLASDVFKLKKYNESPPLWQQIDRKFLEIAIGWRIENRLSKDQVLECYLNSINWGRSIRGIQEASRIYFEKNAADLDLSESAMLAGIVRGPDSFNPFRNMQGAIRERDTTLDSMVVAEFITAQEAEETKKLPLIVRPQNRRNVPESYAVDAIRRDLEYILEEKNIEMGGLTITTTIDLSIQQKAEEALDATLSRVERTAGYPHQTRAQWQALQQNPAIPTAEKPAPSYIQGAACVIENNTGKVLAIVGGRSADESKFNRALQAQRQIGSIFKPFVYMAAFDKGLSPNAPISDSYIHAGEIRGAPRSWHPKNSDGKYGGTYPASYGLIKSRNTMSVRVGNYAGLSNVKEMARMAFNIQLENYPSSYLGTWQATPYQVASAYSLLPNGGVRYRPFLISRITRKNRDGQEEELYATPQIPYRAASANSSWECSKILEQVTASGTAAAVRTLGFPYPCAGKTGTTNNFKDAWFAGYTSSLTCAVWCGMDNSSRTINGGYGGTLALPVWVEIMKTAQRLGYPANQFTRNAEGSGMISCRLCRDSGKHATPGCETAKTAYNAQVPRDSAPAINDFCQLHPLRAVPVTDDDTSTSTPLRAIPVEE